MKSTIERILNLFFYESCLVILLKISFFLCLFVQTTVATAQQSTTAYDSIATVFSNALICCPHQISIDGKQYNSLQVGQNGQVVFEDNNGEKTEVNLYSLFKNNGAGAGFFQKDHLIVLQLDEEKNILLSSDTSFIKRIYFQLEQLYQAGKNSYRSPLKLDLQQTVDSINLMLKRWTSYKPSLVVTEKGAVRMHHRNNQYFNFDFNKLSGRQGWNYEIRGIGLQFYRPGEHVQNNWIHFRENRDLVAFIKFGDVPDKVLNQLQQLLVHASMLTETNTLGATN